MIITTCSDSQLQEMLSRLQRGWEHMGATEPYVSVLTSDLYLRENFELNAPGFWMSGQSDGLKLIDAMERNGIDTREFTTCLDYGCGVGRVSRILANYWKVIGVDHSEDHLRVARQITPPSLNIYYAALTYPDWGSPHFPVFDILFSILVLQHNPPPVVRWLLDCLLGALQPGGVAFFHLPTIMPGYSFSTAEYLANPQSGLIMEMHCVPQRVIFEIAERNRCVPIEVRDTPAKGSLEHTSSLFLLRKKR